MDRRFSDPRQRLQAERHLTLLSSDGIVRLSKSMANPNLLRPRLQNPNPNQNPNQKQQQQHPRLHLEV